MATKNYADAMLDVLTTFMEEDPNFVVMGNEVLGIGPEAMQFGPFQEKYADRIYFPPCSEAAYSALAAGAAMCGQRMLLHLGLAPFAYPAFSTIASEVSTARQGSGGRVIGPGDLPHEPRPAARRRVPALGEPDGDVLERRRHRDRGALGPRRPQGPADARRSAATTRRW